MISSQIFKPIFILLLILCICSCLKFSPVTEIDEKDFFNKTQIRYDTSIGKISTDQNVLVYFYISGHQRNQQIKSERTQLQSARYSYLKALYKEIEIDEQTSLETTDEEEHIVDNQLQQSAQHQLTSQQNESNLFHLEFYIVKCSQQTTSAPQISFICDILSINPQTRKSIVILFTQTSSLISFTGQIKQETLIYFIAKIKENYQPSTRSIVFDEELNKVAINFEIQNQTVEQKAIGFLQGLTRYLTWDALKFFIVFFVVPFLFGYVSTKMQQRANRQKFQKYQANLQEDSKPTQKMSMKSQNESKQKSN